MLCSSQILYFTITPKTVSNLLIHFIYVTDTVFVFFFKCFSLRIYTKLENKRTVASLFSW